jgi:hypothetical protein
MSPFSNLASNVSLGPMNPSVPDSSEVVFFTPYERTGVIVSCSRQAQIHRIDGYDQVMAISGVISCALVSTLLLSIMFSALSPWPGRPPNAPTPFISKQIAWVLV